MQNADDVVNIFLVDREARVDIFLQQKGDCVRELHLGIQRNDALSLCHDIFGCLIVQAEDVGDHLGLIRLDDPLLMAFVDHGHDVLFGDILAALLGIDAEEP